MDLTENEKKVLKSIYYNFFGNSPGDWVWSDCINESKFPSGLHGKTLSGVVASLAKKNLVYCDGRGRDACVMINPNGINAIREINKE